MLQQFLQEFGYFALFLGTFFEGETILVLAGFLAFRGYMDLKLVMIVAFLGSYAGDQLWYFLGRKHGRKLLARKPRWQLMGDKALEHIRKHPDIWVLSFRFVYGLRTVMPVAIGLSGLPAGPLLAAQRHWRRDLGHRPGHRRLPLWRCAGRLAGQR
jgi:membrane protein DedA with SNARE-associated domain